MDPGTFKSAAFDAAAALELYERAYMNKNLELRNLEWRQGNPFSRRSHWSTRRFQARDRSDEQAPRTPAGTHGPAREMTRVVPDVWMTGTRS